MQYQKKSNNLIFFAFIRLNMTFDKNKENMEHLNVYSAYFLLNTFCHILNLEI